MSIGERIRLRRKELGITQEQLAHKAGVFRPTVSDWERGAAEKILAENLMKVATALQTTPNELLGVEDDGHPDGAA